MFWRERCPPCAIALAAESGVDEVGGEVDEAGVNLLHGDVEAGGQLGGRVAGDNARVMGGCMGALVVWVWPCPRQSRASRSEVKGRSDRTRRQATCSVALYRCRGFCWFEGWTTPASTKSARGPFDSNGLEQPRSILTPTSRRTRGVPAALANQFGNSAPSGCLRLGAAPGQAPAVRRTAGPSSDRCSGCRPVRRGRRAHSWKLRHRGGRSPGRCPMPAGSARAGRRSGAGNGEVECVVRWPSAHRGPVGTSAAE